MATLLSAAANPFPFAEALKGPPPIFENSIAIVHYGGWSYQELWNDPLLLTPGLVRPKKWSKQYPWHTKSFPPGIYSVPVHYWTYEEFTKQGHSTKGESTVLLASAMLQTSKEARPVSNNQLVLCEERIANSPHATFNQRLALSWSLGGILISTRWDGTRVHPRIPIRGPERIWKGVLF